MIESLTARWVLTAVLIAARPGRAATAGMSGATLLPFPVLAVTGVVAACCAVASIPWLARAVGPGPRVRDPAAAGQAMMTVSMAAMLIAML